ncbi:carboxypeptidase-like regulatory domain-containing protein [Urechidicola sp. KH5]
MLCILATTLVTVAQSLGVVQGRVSNSFDGAPLRGVSIKLIGTTTETLTDGDGVFEITNIAIGNQLLEVSYEGYETQNFPFVMSEGGTVDLGQILLYEVALDQADLSVISLTADELSADEGGADNTAGLLQSSRDVFLNAAAFDFSATFFRARGYNSENGKVLINGVEMNKMFNGRPQWSNWGGLNDVMRNQELANGLAPSEYAFGGIAGSNNIVMRASEYSAGGRVTYSSSNRSYTGRVMASYASGLNDKGWAYAFLAARRYGNEGYNDATLYDANSFFASIEKVFNDKHSLNLTAFYTPNRRGRSSPNTQEAYDLKSTRYNAYWGYQDGNKRNSRERDIEEPVFMLNHYWNIDEKTSLNTNVAYQFGKIGNSRLDFGGGTLATDGNGDQFILGGGSNPDPTYYQKLPSYFLRDQDNPDYEGAYLAEQAFIEDGQVDWHAMYQANLSSAAQGGNSIYILYDDRNDDNQFTANTIFRRELNDNVNLNAALTYRNLKSENYGHILDLLGGTGYLNVDNFSETLDEAQNDLRNPNRIAQEGDRFRYNFEMNASVFDAFAQAQFSYDKLDFHVSGQFATTSYQRNGLYENGRFPGERSFGESEKLNFSNFGVKAGATYKISGRHLINANASYRTQAPTIRNSFSNSRENNDVVIGLTDEKITSFDASYIFRTPVIQGRVTGYYTQFQDATEISFYYADGLAILAPDGPVESNAFVQEVLTGIDRRNIGLEVGLSAQVTSTIKLKAAAALGDYVYSDNADLYVTSDDFDDVLDFGEAHLKNYHVAGGPQRALSFGFEYRDPEYWWIGATANRFSNGYLDISPIARTSNFVTDPEDGQPFNDYDPEIARELLRQEKFNDYYLVNLVGGKSWRIDDYYVGFFATINNVLNEKYKTGGFEQSRNANYRVLKEDKERDKPVFGPKYWYGFGTTYFLNVYFRF